MGILSNWIEKYHMEKWFKRDNLLLLVLAGILLVVIALPVKEEEKETAAETESEVPREAVRESDFKEYEEWYEYASYLEEKLERILVQVKGVGKVSVMITLEGSEEYIIHKDFATVSNETTETDSQGGSRVVSQTDLQEETIYEKNDKGESPYVVQTKLPAIEGVVIVAEGAANAGVKKNLTDIAAALLNLEIHKVTVAAME